MARFMPGARISQAHGTVRPVDPETGARDALVFAMYHPAAALRTPAIEVESYADIAGVPLALLDARRRRETVQPTATSTEPPAFADPVGPPAAGVAAPLSTALPPAAPTAADPGDPAAPQLTLF
jgi:hypothetical protein